MDSEFRASEWRACLLSFAHRFKSKKFYEFCLRMEKVYLAQWVKGIRKDERYADYSRILGLIETAKTADNVIAAIKYDAEAIKKAAATPNLYTAGFGKYYLLRLELVTCEHEELRQFTAKSVEHVLPQKPDPKGAWAKKHNLKEIHEYVDMIGNLVLLSKSKNSSARNLDFETKKKKYLNSRVSDYPRSVQVLDYTDWTKEIILKRTAEASKLILMDP